MTIYELASLDATAQSRLLREGQLSPLEAIDAAIERFERLNPDLNAVVTEMFDAARACADAPLADGPLAGVPFLLKDLGVACAGVRQTNGSRALVDYVPDHDDELVVRYKRAGLVLMGRTNTPEFGNSSTTEPELFGPTRNPWNSDRSPGGSSGGSAAAVAAGIVAAAHASDGGGSIRTPASCCGVFGLKPSRGRVSVYPNPDQLMGWGVNHAITRSVRDSAALLDVAAVVHPSDLWSLPSNGSFLAALDRAADRLRIGFSVTPPNGAPVDVECQKAVLATAKLLTDLGHDVEEGAPSFGWESFFRVYVVLVAGAFAALSDEVEKTRPGAYQLFERPNQLSADRGRSFSSGEFVGALAEMQRVNACVSDYFVTHDVWLTPTLTRPPLPLGAFTAPGNDSLDRFLEFDTEWNPWLPLANCSGATSASLPMHWSSDGLPVGVQLTMPCGDEERLLRLAATLEEAQPWRDRWPPLSIPSVFRDIGRSAGSEPAT